MLPTLWLVPTVPLASFLLLALLRVPRAAAAFLGVGSVAFSAILSILIAIDFIATPPPGHRFQQVLWSWMSIEGFTPPIGLYLDPLALVMMLVITVVGALIHLYSAEFMADDEGYRRFFAYMNLFVAMMLVLVLADNLLLLFLGWEGVGLCSYLLIGFWYRDPANGYAARKAFVVTRVGDTAFAIGLLLLFTQLQTLDIQTLLDRAVISWPLGSPLAIAAALLLLGGAVGKSAQLPLQTWLPDAMAGPTPVSALIHAATMVTAGVYLIARMHVLYQLAPSVQFAVAVIGALTLLIAAFSALAQNDIKRVLAYSTISQIGYMFLALGVGAWSAALFHFMTHAFFKALLFLAAGAIIMALHHEHDIRRMGGLRRHMPLTFWAFLIGAASLAALPLITAGFFSKDLILWHAWASPQGSPWLWAAGYLGAFVTALYIFRLFFIVFFGKTKTSVSARPGVAMTAPLIILAALAVVGGWVELPPALGDVHLFSGFLERTLPDDPLVQHDAAVELLFALLSAAAALAGIYLAWLLFLRNPRVMEALMASKNTLAVRAFWRQGWGFDTFYDRLFVRPLLALTAALRGELADAIYRGVAMLSIGLHFGLSDTQSGQVRRYAAAVAAGAVVALTIVMFA